MRRGPKKNIITFAVAGEIVGTDDLNQPIYGPPTTRDVFAEVLPVRGAELREADGEQRYSQSIYRFSVDFYDTVGLSTGATLTFEGQAYDIVNIRPDYQRRSDAIIEATIQDEVVSG